VGKFPLIFFTVKLHKNGNLLSAIRITVEREGSMNKGREWREGHKQVFCRQLWQVPCSTRRFLLEIVDVQCQVITMKILPYAFYL
jgi:hypothetical protein